MTVAVLTCSSAAIAGALLPAARPNRTSCSRGVRWTFGPALLRIAAASPAWTSSGRITSPRATAIRASQMRSAGQAFDR